MKKTNQTITWSKRLSLKQWLLRINDESLPHLITGGTRKKPPTWKEKLRTSIADGTARPGTPRTLDKSVSQRNTWNDPIEASYADLYPKIGAKPAKWYRTGTPLKTFYDDSAPDKKREPLTPQEEERIRKDMLHNQGCKADCPYLQTCPRTSETHYLNPTRNYKTDEDLALHAIERGHLEWRDIKSIWPWEGTQKGGRVIPIPREEWAEEQRQMARWRREEAQAKKEIPIRLNKQREARRLAGVEERLEATIDHLAQSL